jgi:diguanylate cyclase (GGDEF)-like protein
MKQNDQRPLPRSDDAGSDDTGLGLEVLERMTRPLQWASAAQPDVTDSAVARRPAAPTHEANGHQAGAGHSFDTNEEAQVRIDPLTGLANRRLLIDRLEHALLRQRTLGGHVVVFHIELNNLSYVDDQLGTAAANATLQEISHRLLSLLRSDDTVARVGHSELIAAVSLQGENTVGLLEERIEAAFESKIAVADREVHMWVTLHSVHAQIPESAETLLARLEQLARLESSGTSRAWSLTLGAP